MNKRRIALIGAGGTIASLGQNSLDFYDYSEGGLKLRAQDLLERTLELRDAFELIPVEFGALSSSHMTPEHCELHPSAETL